MPPTALKTKVVFIFPRIGDCRTSEFIAWSETSPNLGRANWERTLAGKFARTPLFSNSADVRQALWQARGCGLKTIALLRPRLGGSTAGIADVDLIVRADSTARIEERTSSSAAYMNELEKEAE
jgi:hypothetical protein